MEFFFLFLIVLAGMAIAAGLGWGSTWYVEKKIKTNPNLNTPRSFRIMEGIGIGLVSGAVLTVLTTSDSFGPALVGVLIGGILIGLSAKEK